jgi:hypothetical protein
MNDEQETKTRGPWRRKPMSCGGGIAPQLCFQSGSRASTGPQKILRCDTRLVEELANPEGNEEQMRPYPSSIVRNDWRRAGVA